MRVLLEITCHEFNGRFYGTEDFYALAFAFVSFVDVPKRQEYVYRGLGSYVRFVANKVGCYAVSAKRAECYNGKEIENRLVCQGATSLHYKDDQVLVSRGDVLQRMTQAIDACRVKAPMDYIGPVHKICQSLNCQVSSMLARTDFPVLVQTSTSSGQYRPPPPSYPQPPSYDQH